MGIGWFMVIECLRFNKRYRIRRETRRIARDTRKIVPSRWPRNSLPQSSGGDRYIMRYASYSTESPHKVTPVPTSRRKSGALHRNTYNNMKTTIEETQDTLKARSLQNDILNAAAALLPRREPI